MVILEALPPLADERRAPRERAMLSAQLTWGDGVYSFEAVVTQLSKSGCQLAVFVTDVVPSTFQFDLPRRSLSRKAQVVWRTQDQLAVKFLDAENASIKPTASTQEERLRQCVEQIDRLKSENETLRREIAKIRSA